MNIPIYETAKGFGYRLPNDNIYNPDFENQFFTLP